MDRRLWSGAAIAVTVVIAGANALPALLLRAPTDTPAPPAAAPMRPIAAPQIAAPVPQTPTPEVTKAEPAAIVAPVTAATPPPAPTAAMPPPADPAPAAMTFPPVQPPSDEPPAAAPFVAPIRPVPTSHAPEKSARVEQKERKRPRPVRPAIYPLREFFAWRP